jgi:Cu/Ag efflux protein CusF
VEAVKESAKSLTVNGENVPGWMDAMTMDYQVEDPAILKKIKVGDAIAATVYDGDMVLHDVKVTGKKDAGKSKMAK